MDARSLIALLALMLSCSLMVECKATKPKNPVMIDCDDKQTNEECIECCGPNVEESIFDPSPKAVKKCSCVMPTLRQPKRLEPCEDQLSENGCLKCCNGRMNWDLKKGVCRCEEQFLQQQLQPQVQQQQQQQQQGEGQQNDESRCCEDHLSQDGCLRCCGGNMIWDWRLGKCECAGHSLPGEEVDHQQQQQQKQGKGRKDCSDKQTSSSCLACCGGRMNWDIRKGCEYDA